MKLRDLSNITRNKANQQYSLNLRVRQLKKIGITPQQLLEIKLPKDLKIIKVNKVKREVK